MLGKNAPRLDKRTLQFSDYRKTAAPAPPTFASWVTDVPRWPMNLNDRLGSCVVGGMANAVHQWTFYVKEKLGYGTVIVPSDKDVLTAYEAIGGYVPGDPSTDNGCDMLTALKYWRNTGIAGHKIHAFVSVDPKNPAEWEDAIWLFGNLFTGLALPISAQSQDAWTVPNGGAFGDGSPGSWGGHGVICASYSDKTVTCVTWGQTLKMSRNFFRDYVDEAYAILSPDWFDVNQHAPSHFDFAQLHADLASL